MNTIISLKLSQYLYRLLAFALIAFLLQPKVIGNISTKTIKASHLAVSSAFPQSNNQDTYVPKKIEPIVDFLKNPVLAEDIPQLIQQLEETFNANPFPDKDALLNHQTSDS